MQIVEITVKSGKTVGNPHEQYSNLRADVILKAEAPEGRSENWDPVAVVAELQARANRAVEGDLNVRLARIQVEKDIADLRSNAVWLERRMSDELDQAARHEKNSTSEVLDEESKKAQLEMSGAHKQVAASFEKSLNEERGKIARIEADYPDLKVPATGDAPAPVDVAPVDDDGDVE